VEKFRKLAPCRIRQLPLHAERACPSPFDAARRRELVPPVPTVYLWAESARAEDGAAAQDPSGVLRRKRGGVWQPGRGHGHGQAEDRSKIYLGGTSVADLRNHFGVDWHDLQPYIPPDPAAIEKLGVEVHYLGYYLRWHPQACYYYSVEHGGFEASPERTPGTYSKYNSIDDRIDDYHYYTTYIKFGIGRATYDAAQEIRSGDITRDEGVALVKRFDGEFPTRFADEVFRYLSMPEKEFPEASKMFEQPVMDLDYFMHLADTFRSPHLWIRTGSEWALRSAVWHQGR
jgi:hypothetical protein